MAKIAGTNRFTHKLFENKTGVTKDLARFSENVFCSFSTLNILVNLYYLKKQKQKKTA